MKQHAPLDSIGSIATGASDALYPSLWRNLRAGWVSHLMPPVTASGLLIRETTGRSPYRGDHFGTITREPGLHGSEWIYGEPGDLLRTLYSPKLASFTIFVAARLEADAGLERTVFNYQSPIMLFTVENVSDDLELFTSDGQSGLTFFTGLTIGAYHAMALTRQGDSITGGYEGWLNGDKSSTVGNTGTWAPPTRNPPSSDVNSLTIGGRDNTAGQRWIGGFVAAWVFEPFISDSLIELISRDWFAPMRRRSPMHVLVPAAVTGRIMSSLADSGGLAGSGGIAGKGGGLAA